MAGGASGREKTGKREETARLTCPSSERGGGRGGAGGEQRYSCE